MSDDSSECPFSGANTTKGNTATEDWWPGQLDLRILHQHDRKSNPMDEDFDYAKAFNSLDYEALKADIAAVINLDDGVTQSSKQRGSFFAVVGYV